MAERQYKLFMQKGMVEGESALSAVSPPDEGGTSPKPNQKNTVLTTYGYMLARQTVSTIASELAADGNEVAATAINNISKLATMAAAAYATGGLSLIGNAIQGGTTAIVDFRSTQRENRNRGYQRELQGARVTNNLGGSTYD